MYVKVMSSFFFFFLKLYVPIHTHLSLSVDCYDSTQEARVILGDP